MGHEMTEEKIISKQKYTRRPAKKEGFYWLKDASGIEFPAQYLADGVWSTVRHNGLLLWGPLLKLGYLRSISELKP